MCLPPTLSCSVHCISVFSNLIPSCILFYYQLYQVSALSRDRCKAVNDGIKQNMAQCCQSVTYCYPLQFSFKLLKTNRIIEYTSVFWA